MSTHTTPFLCFSLFFGVHKAPITEPEALCSSYLYFKNLTDSNQKEFVYFSLI